MIVERPTVFVLGAGTSIPYRFPSGLALLEQIQGRMTDSGFYGRLLDAGCEAQELEDFRASVGRCGRSSIDAFLEGRTDLANVGKVAMAACLVPLETETDLFAPRGGNIYRYLFTRLSDGVDVDKFRQHRLTIVTYNYDRSLEHYLHQSIKYSYGLTDEDAGALLEATVPIIHVHGQLGVLPWQRRGDVYSRPYEADAGSDAIRLSGQSMRIISERDLEGGVEYMRARERIREAETICFLGFGYHRMNIKRLKLDGWKDGVAMYGTVTGLSSIEVGEAKTCLGVSFNQGDADNVDYLRATGPLV